MAGPSLSRRAFLQLASLSLGSVVTYPLSQLGEVSTITHLFLRNDITPKLGRVIDTKVKVYMRPDDQSGVVKELTEDSLVVWQQEVRGVRSLWENQRFVETPDGFIYSPNLQPVYNQPNTPYQKLPASGGFWAEVSIPFVDLNLANPPARSPWLSHTALPRLYYSQIMWVDDVRVDEGGLVWYHVIEKYGSYGDEFWALGDAFRPISAEELTPIHPEAQDKLVEVNLTYQTMSCFEGDEEVFFCRVSTGGLVTSKEKPKPEWATPPGKHTIWRKMISVHMSGGTTGGGYDLPGIGWTTLFSGLGLAIHSTFWHNSFGVPRSHGCVNARPEDAKWLFRWTLPEVSLEPGDLTVKGQASTRVLVKER